MELYPVLRPPRSVGKLLGLSSTKSMRVLSGVRFGWEESHRAPPWNLRYSTGCRDVSLWRLTTPRGTPLWRMRRVLLRRETFLSRPSASSVLRGGTEPLRRSVALDVGGWRLLLSAARSL